MTKTRMLAVVVLIALALAAVWFLLLRSSDAAYAASARPVQVRWLISHQPVDVFARATEIFADELAKESGGTMTLKIVTPADLGLPATGDVSEIKIEDLFKSGSVDLASPYTIPLGARDADFWSLNLPFLFSSYEQAMPILDGAAGTQMLQGLASKSDARGLAFTMSGGFRIIASKNTKIASVADLKGKRIATSGGPVAEATLTALGAIPVPIDLENGTQADLSNVDGVETTYARLSGIVGTHTQYTKYINETNHSLFLTALIASNPFFDSLTASQQAALQKAALAAAKAEREDSIELNAKTKSSLIGTGSIVTGLAPAAREAFVKTTQPVYAQFEQTFGNTLIDSLRK